MLLVVYQCLVKPPVDLYQVMAGQFLSSIRWKPTAWPVKLVVEWTISYACSHLSLQLVHPITQTLGLFLSRGNYEESLHVVIRIIVEVDSNEGRVECSRPIIMLGN